MSHRKLLLSGNIGHQFDSQYAVDQIGVERINHVHLNSIGRASGFNESQISISNEK